MNNTLFYLYIYLCMYLYIDINIYVCYNKVVIDYKILRKDFFITMVAQIFTTLGDIVQGFAQLLVSMFGSVVSIFYTAPTGSETVGSLTIVGTLSLIALGSGLVIWGLSFIRRMIRVKTNA